MEPGLTVYHGLGVKLHFERFTAKFNLPISTSRSIAKAQSFSENGIILQLKSGVTCCDDLSKTPKYLPVSCLSDFPEEDEKLFHGFNVILEISDIIESNTLKHHSHELKMFNQFQQTIQNQNVDWNDQSEMVNALAILIENQQHYEEDKKISLGKNDDDEKSQYISQYGKELFNFFCRHPSTIAVRVHDFDSLPNQLRNIMFMNHDTQMLSLISILKLFPYVMELELNGIHIYRMKAEGKNYINAILEYIDNVNDLYGRYLKQISFKSQPQQQGMEMFELKTIRNESYKQLTDTNWLLEYHIEAKNIHTLTFTNYDRKEEEKMKQLQLLLQQREGQFFLSRFNSEELIERIDNGLRMYYYQHGKYEWNNWDGDGKFVEFITKQGLQTEDVMQELGYGENSILIEFDVVTDEHSKPIRPIINNFPLNPEIEDKTDKNKEIHRIIFYIAVYGHFTTIQKNKVIPLDTNICSDITVKEIDEQVEIYSNQMSCIGSYVEKDNALKYFLAIGQKQRFPFLMNIIDSYTKDKAFQNFENKSVSIENWIQNNPFIQSLKSTDKDRLKQAMITFSKRIMQRIQLKPILKVNDDLKQITEYIMATTTFISKLVNNLCCTPPFQVDLLIAVKEGSIRVDEYTFDTDEDEDDEQEEKTQTHNKSDTQAPIEIPRVPDAFRNINITFVHHTTDESDFSRKISTDGFGPIQHILHRSYQDFRSKLHDNHKNESFDEKTYPQHKRFSIFVDRRELDNNCDIYDNDEVTFFQPPKDCNTIPKHHVPEFGFELIRKCIIPSEETNITALDTVNGQLLTFMFNVEQSDEIKCYLVWNGQTMRFHGEHIMQVLPNLFIDNESN
eukprot:81786_1